MNEEEQKAAQAIEKAASGLSLRTKLEIIAAIIAGGIFWYVATPTPAPVNQWQASTPSPQLEKVPQEAIKPPQVIVYKKAAKKALDLPPAIQADDNQHVLQSTSLPIDDHPQTCTTIIDEKTGKSETLVRNEPLPWFAVEQHGSIGIGYGITSGLMQGFALNGHEDFFQVKALHFGVDGSVFTGGAYFAGLGMAYHW